MRQSQDEAFLTFPCRGSVETRKAPPRDHTNSKELLKERTIFRPSCQLSCTEDGWSSFRESSPMLGWGFSCCSPWFSHAAVGIHLTHAPRDNPSGFVGSPSWTWTGWCHCLSYLGWIDSLRRDKCGAVWSSLEQLSAPRRRDEPGLQVVPEFASQRSPLAAGASQPCWPGPSISPWTIW